MNRRVVLLSFFVMIVGQSNESLAYSWPVEGNPSSWSYGYAFAQVVNNERHLGVDIMKNALTPVIAPVDCEIFISKTQVDKNGNINPNGYGTYIVAKYITPTGEERVFGIGHMSQRSGYKAKPIGKYSEGTILGYVGYDDENGKGESHIHWFDYGAPYDGLYHYYGYTGSEHDEDVDYDQNGDYIGGKFTDPIKQWLSYQSPNYTYDNNAYTGYGPVLGGEHTDWMYELSEANSQFNSGDT